MKIAFVALSTIPSDTANSIQVMKTCHAITQIGHEVILIVPANSAPRKDWAELASIYGIENQFAIEYLSTANRRFFPFYAFKQAARHKPDLIYSWLVQTSVYSLLQNIPVIYEIHGIPTGMFGPVWHYLFLKLRGRKRALVITRALQNQLDARFGSHLRTDEIIIAPNGVDLEKFENLLSPQEARRALNWREAPTVLCAGHLYAGRGVDLFVELAKQLPNADFVWVGGNPNDVAMWREKTSAFENLRFVGFIPNGELPQYQSAADVLIMPYGKIIAGSSGGNSASYASPMKMFEYLATGRAIVASDLSVVREVLDDQTAVFCNPDNLSEWVSVLRELLGNDDKRNMLAKNARLMSGKYSWVARAKNALGGWIK